MDYINERVIFTFWTGDNVMSESRARCFNLLESSTQCRVILVTKDNLSKYVKNLHPAYQYLSETHKADYLRTYFMNHYGGGYSWFVVTSL